MAMIVAAMFAASGASAQPVPSAAQWSSLAGDEARTATRRAEAPLFDAVRWTLSTTASGQAIRFVGPSSVAATALPEPRLFTAGVVDGQTLALAIDAEDGQIVWTTPIPDLVFASWSSPALSAGTGEVLYATGSALIALRMDDGVETWRTELTGPPVNVSPLVTSDLGHANRAFVTDYGGFGGLSWLYCINVSPRHATLNPHDPGDIVWSAMIGSSTGGTPAYLDGVVYVCSTGLDYLGVGEIRAFDASAPSEPSPLWIFNNTQAEGFFRGLTIRERNGSAYLYAATYAFYGLNDSANMVKVDAADGQLVWSVPCNRTDSIPIVLDDDRIVLASGIQGFGSVPMVQMFQDQGTHAAPLWDTATGTWNDLNNNGELDLGEFFLVGGWTTHPVVLDTKQEGASPRLLVGAIPTDDDYFGPYTDLYELDLALTPAAPGFIVQHTDLAGSSPALLGRGVYSIGRQGLVAIGPPPPRPDVDGNGRVDIEDLYAWSAGRGERDIDRNGTVDEQDQAFLVHELRRNESRDMIPYRR